MRTPVLLLRSAQPPRGPVHVVIEASGETGRLLGAAVTMAGRRADGPVVTVWVADAPMERELEGKLARARLVVRVHSFSDPAGNEALISAVAGCTLVLNAASRLLELQTWWERFARARCALLLMH